MTYSAGGLIQTTDYNGFISTTANANVNDIWAVGSSDKGYGQTALGTVSVGGTVTATQWAGLVNNISSMASHQGTSITSRTAPVAGNTITILNSLNTDLTNLTTSRGNAAGRGTQYTSWTGDSSRTSATGNGSWSWTLTFTHTITFASADAARYFFNAGGMIKWETSKTSTGTEADDEWNDLANTLVGDIYITGGTGTQTIAGTAYTGTTKVGGTGTPTTLTTTTGWYDLTTSDTIIYKQFADTSPYTGSYIQIAAKTAGTGTQLVLTTTWFDPGGRAQGSTDAITGGTPTTGISFGSAPATVVTYYPPSSTYLTTASWGTPTVAATVTSTSDLPVFVAVASTQNASGGTSLVINKPTGTVDGDLMVAFMCASSSTSWTGDTSWTEVLDPGTTPGIRIAWKVAASEGASYTFTAGTSRTLAGSILTYRGAAYDKVNSVTSASPSVDMTSITPTGAESIVIAFAVVTGASVTVTTPNSMTNRVQQNDGTAPSYMIADQGWPATATGIRNSSGGTTTYGVLMAIKST